VQYAIDQRELSEKNTLRNVCFRLRRKYRNAKKSYKDFWRKKIEQIFCAQNQEILLRAQKYEIRIFDKRYPNG
jgi:hypothetical protein